MGAVFIVLAVSGCSSGPASQTGASNRNAPIPVRAAGVTQGDLPLYLHGIGSVVPITVILRTRVDGQLMQVFFQEGQLVKTGDRLAEIDPRPFQAALIQAEGQLARDQALLANARLDLKRYRTLARQDSIARQQYDTQKALVRQDEGQVTLDQGALDNARVQLVYCHIDSPLTGKIGLREVDPGNIVHATDVNGLAVISQLQPADVIFTLPEDQLPEVLAKFQPGPSALAVDAFDRTGTRRLDTGRLLAIDSQIDPATGTIRLKARFPNPKNILFPNQFVNARLLIDTLVNATLVPTAGLQIGPKGSFVYLVKPDDTVTVRPVKTGPAEGASTAIEQGLAPGDRVVIEGTDRLREGAKILLNEPQGQ